MEYKRMPSVMESSVLDVREMIRRAMVESPLPPAELLRNLGLYLLPMDLRRFLFFDSIYRKILPVTGVILEFGCRWGQNLAIMQSLRAIYEPYNIYRRIIGFDTFSGLQGVTEKDGTAAFAADGAYGVSGNYEQYLENLLALKETQSPVGNVRKFEVVKGDAAVTFKRFLDEHPEMIVSFAYFDMDIYGPTAECLRLLRSRLTKGSIVGFDELNFPEFPGETVALQEVFGLDKVRLRRNRWSQYESFFVVQ